ncbi:MAG: aminotransferase class I/II-fold pyridoxal phosphate-dependent enzyme [Alphaproteobacteria bacterium]|nr:aminotransferase class I/II-fold pyridoxal phosphate-dependent enzyme [Alphaproteobacteria bacterium]
MDPIQFFDLKTQAKRLRADIDRRIAAVLDHGAYIGGPEVGELETRLAAFTGARECVAVASGTDALLIAIMGEGVGPGDAVFLPAFTYNATANAILIAGGTPVFVDVERETANLDPADLERRIAATLAEGRLRPRMVIPVDLYGLPADYAAINAIAARHGMVVLADAAQSLGGRLGNRSVGALAEMSATSFYPTKTLGGYGDGGAVFTDDPARAARWRSIRWHGTDEMKRESIRVGVNGRLDSLQCAVLLSKLEIFAEELASRRRLAARYAEQLDGLVERPKGAAEADSAYGLFTIYVKNRDQVQAVLKAKGVPTSIYYLQALHHHAAFAAHAPAGGLPVAERLADEVLSLPFHPYLSDTQLDHVCAALRESL